MVKKELSKIYGMAFHSPLLIYSLVPPSEYTPILLLHENAVDIRKALVEASSSKRTAMVLVGSLPVLHLMLKEYMAMKEKLQAKVILFDFPGILTPFNFPHIEWLDCDNQSGGAWQILKLKPEAMEEKFLLLPAITDDLCKSLLKLTRHVPAERVSEMEEISRHLPETYKDLIAAIDGRKREGKIKKATLTSLIREFLFQLTGANNRKIALSSTLDYLLGKVTKREFANLVEPMITTDALKKSVLVIRKWIEDKKHGGALYNSYVDYVCNADSRSFTTITNFHSIEEKDLLTVAAYSADKTFSEKEIAEAKKLPPDVHPPKLVKIPKIESLFGL